MRLRASAIALEFRSDGTAGPSSSKRIGRYRNANQDGCSVAIRRTASITPQAARWLRRIGVRGVSTYFMRVLRKKLRARIPILRMRCRHNGSDHPEPNKEKCHGLDQ